MVSLVLDAKDKEKALKAIDEAFDSLLENIDLEDIKRYFLSEKKGRVDYIQSYINDDFMDRFFMSSIPTSKEEEQMNSITMKDMQLAYQKIKKSLVFVYGGDKHE